MTLQQEIIAALGVKSTIDPATEFRFSVDFIKTYLKKHSFLRTLVLGISGGQDSTLTGKICQQTISDIRQETGMLDYRFIAVRLPYGQQRDEADCWDAIAFIQPDQAITINIKSTIQASEKTLREAGIVLSDYIKGNDKARERMKVQYSIANMNAGLVVGTYHAAEAVTGFFTKYGDGGTDINPLFRLNKRQGKAILQYLGCPEHLYLKVPTADLEENHPALPDETALGVTYEMIDNYLEGQTIDLNIARMIETRYKLTKHKRYPPVTVFDDY
ncbi:ammonia-dependent NAD(+) synthetase [Sodalis endosymbiont of Henestaris halophilus]|uniref:ammonia-dependent NAD(+) synthetase n=1 Tax=Sodalis endosymbiont of Henestaris halophilus TaxID=1929246 RepID=UPI000BC05B9A|nr:ammonia-dependent NAD(+) synthetase [Sodalis endosymbiont of Henestaris halophilus]SNC58798.1 NH(3)-dependent NAD(+) synthetase [Sodalis endosymbiont of Henestaris halophilus]